MSQLPEPELEPEPEMGMLRAKLETLDERKLQRRAAKAGVSDARIDEMDDAEDPKEFLIELIIKADLNKISASDLNIKQRLDRGEWESYESPPPKWWQQPDLAEQVNRLRAAARIRESLPDNTRPGFTAPAGTGNSTNRHLLPGSYGVPEIPDLYPQLVVLGDGNTGKSTVLNRFAEFAFSAVTDGVCTRRPVRLQLRPVMAKNRARMQAEELLAICTMVDTEDQSEQEYTFRTAHREEDEDLLRRAVKSRAREVGGSGSSPEPPGPLLTPAISFKWSILAATYCLALKFEPPG